MSLEGLKKYNRAPKIEFDVEDCFQISKETYDYDISGYYSIACEHYERWGKYGPNGDVVFVEVDYRKRTFQIDQIGRLVYPKPGMTADLVPFIRDVNGQLFFVGIIRKDPPGAGGSAFMGGFREVRGEHFASGAETAIKEGKEESGLKVRPINEIVAKQVRDTIGIKEFRAKVKIGELEERTVVHLLGEYHTSEDEIVTREDKDKREKRVHETIVYTFVVNVNVALTEQSLADMLKAGDDASKIFVYNLSTSGGIRPDLVFGHHRLIFEDALRLIQDVEKHDRC